MALADDLRAGKQVRCVRCDGHGVIESWPNTPDECPDCGGSGLNWQYPSGLIARYYSGPIIGRAERPATAEGGRNG